jgi:hypothetical protein
MAASKPPKGAAITDKVYPLSNVVRSSGSYGIGQVSFFVKSERAVYTDAQQCRVSLIFNRLFDDDALNEHLFVDIVLTKLELKLTDTHREAVLEILESIDIPLGLMEVTLDAVQTLPCFSEVCPDVVKSFPLLCDFFVNLLSGANNQRNLRHVVSFQETERNKQGPPYEQVCPEMP